MSPKRARLGDILVTAGVITADQLEGALKVQENATGRKPKLGALIVKLGFAAEDEIARALAQQLDVAYVDLNAVIPDQGATRMLPRSIARRHQLLPIRKVDDGIVIAMADPTNVFAIDDVRTAIRGSKVSVVVATASAINEYEERFYASGLGTSDILDRLGVAAEVEVVPEEHDIDPTSDTDLEALQRSAHTAPIVRLVNAILADAVAARATDVHVEPQQTEVKVRYRVDGLLREVMVLPKHVQALVVSRIKIISGMDIAERRKPQDGRGKIMVDDTEVDSRVSCVPTFGGEKVVIRLLRAGEESVALDSLGLDDHQRKTLGKALLIPQGLIVFTGPTGAGKTSTMYAALDHIKSPEKNIVTLEDPIEYQIPELNQMQIDEKSGLSFAGGLRSILRQDPDVIMVGEIRDLETAQIVMQSSLTGHLVLSSLHTNDAASAVTRLVDLGVEPYLIASALELVIAQRLIRVICDNCKEPAEVSNQLLSLLGLAPIDLEGSTIMKGAGCERCGYSGYRGRTGIYEVLPINQQLREQITAQVSDSSLSYAARASGVRTLRASGLARVKAGITTLEEMLRVTHVEREEVVRCPACRQEVDPAFLVCPYCQEDLSGDACPQCHRDIQAEWTICPYCRADLPSKDKPSDGRPRILVIDDDTSLIKLVEGLLADSFEVLSAATAEEGLRRANIERPDLILLDLWLPDVDGIEVAERLRRSAITSLIPVIMLTGDDSSEVASLRAGVDDYVVKPFDEDALVARIETVLRRSAPVRAHPVPAS